MNKAWYYSCRVLALVYCIFSYYNTLQMYQINRDESCILADFLLLPSELILLVRPLPLGLGRFCHFSLAFTKKQRHYPTFESLEHPIEIFKSLFVIIHEPTAVEVISLEVVILFV